MKKIAYMSVCILYFAVFFAGWIFIMDHLSNKSENAGITILSTIVTIFLFYLWLTSSKSRSFILDRMIDINKRRYAQDLRRKYANFTTRELHDKMWEYKRPLSSFSAISPNYERDLKKQNMSDEYQNILKIREQDELVNYLKSNIMIWIAISGIAFYLGYVW